MYHLYLCLIRSYNHPLDLGLRSQPPSSKSEVITPPLQSPPHEVLRPPRHFLSLSQNLQPIQRCLLPPGIRPFLSQHLHTPTVLTHLSPLLRPTSFLSFLFALYWTPARYCKRFS